MALRLRYLNTLLFVGICFLLFACSAPAQAQQNGSDPLFIDVQPSTPVAGAQTTITIDSSMVDLSQAAIRWSVNGSPKAAGNGLRTFTFTMGPAGKSTVVGLTVVPIKTAPFTRNFTFTPGSVLMLWEAATYVPPFYQGKSLYVPGADIRVVAVPDVRDAAGNLIPTSELNFKWQINGDAYADRSGLGVDVLTFPGNWSGGTEEVVVNVLRKDGSKAAKGVVFIPDNNPLVLFYKKDPLRGMLYDHALTGNERLTETETTIVAEPYYISGRSRKSVSNEYSWTLNGESVAPQGNDPAVITLRQNSGQTGSVTLAFSVRNTDVSKLLQTAQASVVLLFGAQNSNFFGF
jgi:hypothetical protein